MKFYILKTGQSWATVLHSKVAIWPLTETDLKKPIFDPSSFKKQDCTVLSQMQ